MIKKILYILTLSLSLCACKSPLEETKRDLKELEKIEEDGVVIIDDIEGMRI